MTQQITLLGRLAISENGIPSPLLESRKGCALVAYLIVTGQTQSRESSSPHEDSLLPSEAPDSLEGDLLLCGFCYPLFRNGLTQSNHRDD